VAMPRKTLWQFVVRDRTFLARRHAHLLLSSPLLDEPVLRALQQAYRDAQNRWERAEIARRFERTVRRPGLDLAPADRNAEYDAYLRARQGPKSLTERVLDHTFNPSRHYRLMREDHLPQACPIPGPVAKVVWQHLLTLQELIRITPWAYDVEISRLRKRIYRRFADTISQLPREKPRRQQTAGKVARARRKRKPPNA
jgi:hypothetical protein